MNVNCLYSKKNQGVSTDMIAVLRRMMPDLSLKFFVSPHSAGLRHFELVFLRENITVLN